jgi:hypothetical protein
MLQKYDFLVYYKTSVGHRLQQNTVLSDGISWSTGHYGHIVYE